jgi:hypothetical protein
MRLIILAGVPGSDRTNLANHIVENGLVSDLVKIEKGSAIHINSDDFVKDTETREVNNDTYIESIIRGLENQKNVLIKSTFISIVPVLKGLRDKGYINIDTTAIYLPCDLDIAKKKRTDTAANEKNFIPEKYDEIIKLGSTMLLNFVKNIERKNGKVFQAEFEQGKTLEIKEFNREILQSPSSPSKN